MDYRPLKFDERYTDPLIRKMATEKGRKILDLQSYHHCYYVGKGFVINAREDLEQVVVVMNTPSLGSRANTSRLMVELWSMLYR